MAQFGNKVKLAVLKGMEAIGQGASNLASNAQQRLQELNLDNQRRELLNAFPLKAYELWQKGESLPQPLEEMLKELKDVDERLNLIRAQRFAKLEEKKQQNAEPSPEGASEDEAVTEETAEENVKEAPSAAETEAATETAETIPAPDETTEPAAETTSAETTTVPEAGADTSEYAAMAKTLFGALNYIDQIGSGNLPKDETDTIQTTKSGVTYERVTKTQFSSTADLKAYMTASLTQKMIDSRYAAILGTDQPLYIDANGGLYGRQYATSGGFTWIDPEQVTIYNATDSSFTASMQYDNFGAADTLTVQIVLDNGLWKIDSMQ